MRHIPDNDKVILIILNALVPILGYFYMYVMKRAAIRIIDRKIIDKGIYKNNPVTGDDVIPIAKRCQRVGTLTFVFSIVVSVLFVSFLYNNW